MTARFHSGNYSRIILLSLGILALSCLFTGENLRGQSAPEGRKSQPNIAAPQGSRAKINRVTPGGRLANVPNTKGKDSTASLIMGNEILSCPLQEGETTFIISLPKPASLDRLTFVNENAEAKGEMKIAVSNFRLPANSPKWIEVSGTTAFAHKRRFDLSMVGVEARYLKLSFHIDKKDRVAASTPTTIEGVDVCPGS